MKRWLLRITAGLFAVVIGLLVIMLVTETGARWVWGFAKEQVPSFLPGVSIDAGVSGRLIGPLTLSGFSYQSPSEEVAIGQLRFDWQPMELFEGTAHITELRADQVKVKLLPVEVDTNAEPSVVSDEMYPSVPIDIVVDALAVTEIEVTPPASADPIKISALRLAAQFDSDRARISALEVIHAQGSLDLNAQVRNEAGLPFELTAKFSAEVPDTPILSGELSTQGTLQVADLQMQVAAPYNVNLRASVEQPLEELVAELGLELHQTDLGWLRDDLENLPLDAVVQARYSRDLLDVEILNLDLANSQLSVVGGYDLAARNVDLSGEWQKLRWPLQGATPKDPPLFLSDQGTFILAGSLDSYVLSLNGDVLLTEDDLGAFTQLVGSSGRLSVQAAGSDKGIEVEELAIDVLGGEVGGLGTVTWSPSLVGNFNIAGSSLDLSLLDATYPDELNFSIVAGITSSDAGVEEINIERAELSVAQAQISGSGVLGAASDFVWRVDVADIGLAASDVGGSANISGRVVGAMQDPEIEAQFAIQDLSHPQLGSERLNMAGEFGGLISRHKLILSGQSPWGGLSLDLSGSWSSEVYEYNLANLLVPLPEEQGLYLEEPAVGRVGGDVVKVEPLCLTSLTFKVCTELDMRADTQTMNFSISDFPLRLLAPVLPTDLMISGSVSGEGELSDWQIADRDQQGRATLRLDEVMLSAQAGEEIEELLAFAPGKVELNLAAQGMSLIADLPLQAAGGIALQGRLLNGPVQIEGQDKDQNEDQIEEREIEGRVTIELPSIAVLDEFVADIDGLVGGFSSDLTIAGSIAKPEISGTAELSEGRVDLPELGVGFTDIDLLVAMPAAGEIELNGALQSGEGRLTLGGAFTDLFGDVTGRVQLTGSDFEAVDNELAQVQISPDVQADVGDGELRLSGKVDVPLAKIVVDAVPQSAVKPSDDQILVDAQGTEEEVSQLATFAQLELNLGDEVSFEGMGLAASFRGSMSITEQPDEVTTATGEITITEGSYQAYGQDLDVQDGKLIWVGGPVADPGIDILAMRQPKPDIKVGVRARGALSNPRLSLTSTPALTESNQLSYLILGRPIEGSTAAEGSYLNKAALALGIKGGNYLTERYGDRLGVDQIGIETAPGEDQEKAALVVGKYLSPKLYVSYGLGLLDSISTLRLEYTLSRHWRLKTESSAEQSGGDILYSIEVE